MAPRQKYVGSKLCVDCVYFLVHEMLVRWVEYSVMHGTYSITITRHVQSVTVLSALSYSFVY